MTHWRTRITGTLTLESPLALGDGGYEPPATRDEADQGGIDTVQKTADNRAVIPGSSLKGVLRAWLESRGVSCEVIMGRAARPKTGGQKTSELGSGGKVEFGFSYSQAPIEFKSAAAHEQSVAIDRVTRAAAERLLFARQIVPAGTVFDVELLGFDLAEQDLAALLAALDGFNAADGDRVRLGSGTNNAYGTARWELAAAATLGPDELANWVAGGAAAPLWEAATPLVRQSLPPVKPQSRSVFHVALQLDFCGWFLVKDPSKSKRKRGGPAADDDDRKADAFPRLTGDGRVLLPPRSFRGAFRSQLERIARTLNADVGGDPNRDSPTGSSRIIESLFGDTTCRAVVRCSPFEDSRPSWNWHQARIEHGSENVAIPDAVKNGEQTALLPREFVAIDRFTGGAAEHLKFDCVAAWRPQLTGSLSLDLDELSRRGKQYDVPPAAAFGLLLLALRDLCEGDVSFGFGSGKGFGECRAMITAFQLPDPAGHARAWGLAEQWDAVLAAERRRTAVGNWSKLTSEHRALAGLCVGLAR